MTTPHLHPHHDGHSAEPAYPNMFNEAFSRFNLHLHDDAVEEEVRKLCAEKCESYRTPEHLRQIFAAIELTSLKVTDSAESILQWVERINEFTDQHPALPHLAGLCVYPRYACIVAQSLEVENMQTVCVVGGFPASQTFAEIKTAETGLAVMDGATEVDCVMPVGALLSEDYETVYDEIHEVREAAGNARLKVILETGALQTAERIKRAAIMALYSGADFLKTSTGKITPGATPLAAYVMCQTLKEYFQLTGERIGFKAAGGIATVDDALTYYTIAREVLGPEWTEHGLLRFGASRLADNVATALLGEPVRLG